MSCIDTSKLVYELMVQQDPWFAGILNTIEDAEEPQPLWSALTQLALVWGKESEHYPTIQKMLEYTGGKPLDDSRWVTLTKEYKVLSEYRLSGLIAGVCDYAFVLIEDEDGFAKEVLLQHGPVGYYGWEPKTTKDFDMRVSCHPHFAPQHIKDKLLFNESWTYVAYRCTTQGLNIKTIIFQTEVYK